MKNKRGQVIFYTLMLSVVVILLALALANPVKEFVNTARAPTTENSTGLDCLNGSISDFDKGTCMLVDLNTPYFIGILLALAGTIIGGRIILGE